MPTSAQSISGNRLMELYVNTKSTYTRLLITEKGDWKAKRKAVKKKILEG